MVREVRGRCEGGVWYGVVGQRLSFDGDVLAGEVSMIVASPAQHP